MTKDEVLTVLHTVAEEFEAAAGEDREDLRELARAYRRASQLVQEIEVRRRPGRPRGSRNRVTPTAVVGRRRRAGGEAS